MLLADPETLKQLQQLFPADGDGVHRVPYAFTPAGVSTSAVMGFAYAGSEALALSSEEKAFIQQVFERLATEIAIAPVLSPDAAEPFQLASVARVLEQPDAAGATYTGFFTRNRVLQRDRSFVLIELDLDDEPGLSLEEQSTIVHELGHALGLDHPGGDPDDPAFTDRDTIMSYNIGGNQPATWFSPWDLDQLGLVWGRRPDAPDASDDSSDPFRIDAVISGGIRFEGFNAAAGDVLLLDAEALSLDRLGFQSVRSPRALRRAKRQRPELVFDQRRHVLYLNANSKGSGWGVSGGALGLFDDGVLLVAANLQLV